MRGLTRLAAIPELAVLLFAFLIHLVWEFLQVPAFAGLASAPHWASTVRCLKAAAGDAAIAAAAYMATSIVLRRRAWLRHFGASAVLVFMAVGLVAAISLEWINVEVLRRWSYAEWHPRLPLLGTGLAVVLQWIVVPPIALWLAHMHVVGASHAAGQK